MARLLRIVPLVAVVVVLVLLHQHVDLSVEGMRRAVEGQGAFGPILFIVLCAVGVIVHAPELLLIAVGGMVFGKLAGFLYGWLGAMVGASVAFLLARYFFRDAVQRHLRTRIRQLEALDDHLERHGFLTIIGLRLVFFMAPPLNWFLGTTRLPFRAYLAGSALGAIPGTLITVSFAERVATSDSWRDVFGPTTILLGILLVGFLIVSALVARKWLGSARIVEEG